MSFFNSSKLSLTFVPSASHCSVVLSQRFIKFNTTPFTFGKICFSEETYHSCFCTAHLGEMI